jgi:hypothetical protein
VYALLQHRRDARQRPFMAYFAQVLSQLLDCRVAFPLVACCDDEDEGLGLRTRLQELVDQAGANAQS